MLDVAVVGYGYWGEKVARAVAQTAGATLAAVVDPDAGRRAAAAQRHPGAKTAATVDGCWQHCDAVAVAIPPGLHAEVVADALSRGKHVLVAKPLALTWADARQLARLALDAGRVLLVDHTFVYTGAVRKIRDLVAQGRIGDRLWIYDSERVNLGVYRPDCDVVWDLGPHDLSILSTIHAARPVEVSCVGSDFAGTGRCDDAHVTLWMDDGAMAHMHLSWLSPVKIRRTMIAGSRAMIVYDDVEPSEKVRVYDRSVELVSVEEERAALVDYRMGDCWAPHLDPSEALAVECVHFVECCAGAATPLTGGSHAGEVVRVLEAATASLASDGRRIPV